MYVCVYGVQGHDSMGVRGYGVWVNGDTGAGGLSDNFAHLSHEQNHSYSTLTCRSV